MALTEINNTIPTNARPTRAAKNKHTRTDSASSIPWAGGRASLRKISAVRNLSQGTAVVSDEEENAPVMDVTEEETEKESEKTSVNETEVVAGEMEVKEQNSVVAGASKSSKRGSKVFPPDLRVKINTPPLTPTVVESAEDRAVEEKRAKELEMAKEELKEAKTECEKLAAQVEELKVKADRIESVEEELERLQDELAEALKSVSECTVLRAALVDSQNSVEHHESELAVLREAISTQSTDLAEAMKSRDFAEAEAASKQSAIKELEKEKLMQAATLASLTDKLAQFVDEHEQAVSELAAARQDLKDALDREARQEESSQLLLAAQSELERSYADAVAQLEAQKVGQRQSVMLLEQNTEDEESDDDEGLNTVQDHTATPCDTDTDIDDSPICAPNTTLDEYDVIDLQKELHKSSNARIVQKDSASERPSLKSKFSSFVSLNRSKPNHAESSRAVKLFAVRELEDELAEDRLLLSKLCLAFASTDETKLKRLKRLQQHIDDTMDSIRVTAIKLKAVRSFVE